MSGVVPGSGRRTGHFLLAALLGTTAVLGLMTWQPAIAQTAAAIERNVSFSIPAQPLESAIVAFSRAADINVIADGAIPTSLQAGAVFGTATVPQGLNQLLAGTGFSYRMTDERSVTLINSAAEPVAYDGSMMLDMLTVTAGGFTQTISQAPASITVVPSTVLEQRSYQTLTDAVQDVEGVSLTGGSNGSISIRGMPSSGTLVLVDGRRQGSTSELNPKGGSAVEDNWAPPIGAVDQIEVVRGPMSSRYGASAMGGVINIITKKVADEWHGSVGTELTVQGNSDSGNEAQGDFYVSGPIVEGMIGLQAWGYKTWREEDLIAGGFNAFDNINGTGRLWFTPTSDHDLMLEVHRSQQQYSATPGKSGTSAGDVFQDYNRFSYTLAHEGRWDFGTSTLSYSHEEAERDQFTAGVEDIWKPGIVHDTLDGNIVIPLGDHTVSLGAQYLHHNLHIDGMRNADLPPLPDGSPATGLVEADVSQWAVFAEDGWQVNDALLVTGGVRYDDNSIFGGQITPKLYANLQLNDMWTIKGGVASGFVPPTMQQFYPSIGNGQRGGATTWGNPDLLPETSLNKEVGLYFDNYENFSANVTYFHTTYENKIANTGSRALTSPIDGATPWLGPDGRPMSVYFNVPEATIQGVELAGRWRATDTLALSGSYTYTHSEMNTDGVSVYGFPLSQADGLAPVSTPQHMANIRLDWDATETLSAYVRANYRGEDSQSINWGGGSQPGLKSAGSLFTLDVGASWNINDSTTLSAAILNVTDATGYDPDNTSTYQYIEDGRRFWVGLRSSF